MAITKKGVIKWALAAAAAAAVVLVAQTGAAGPAAQAGPSFSQVVVVGDSFSDNGNLYALTGGPLPGEGNLPRPMRLGFPPYP